MRLIDRVVNASAKIELSDCSGARHIVTGVGAKANAIGDCDLRYILDPLASNECMNLVFHASNGLFEPANPLLRLPAQTFWLEWFGPSAHRPKIGMLVEAWEGGRRGLLTGFFQDEWGNADKIGARIEFDLDQPGAMLAGRKMRHATCAHLSGLLACARLQIDPDWDRFFRTRGGDLYDRALIDLAEHSWYLLPAACAFAAMLNSRDVLIETMSDLDRLNAARIRRGHRPLLDHIEVSIRLDDAVRASSAGHVERIKSSPRLHYVRGHFVNRAGKKFWRSSHLRGDAERPILGKTVRVVGGYRRSAALAARK